MIHCDHQLFYLDKKHRAGDALHGALDVYFKVYFTLSGTGKPKSSATLVPQSGSAL